MPGKATNDCPIFNDESKDFSYKGTKKGQVIPLNAFHFGNPGVDFSPNDEGGLLGASLAAKKLWVPIPSLKQGDQIVGYRLIGYVTSAGNAVTVDCSLMKIPKAGTPADPTGDASNAITQVSKTANYTMDEEQLFTAPYTVITDEAYNLEVLATTLALTTVQVVGIELIVNRK